MQCSGRGSERPAVYAVHCSAVQCSGRGSEPTSLDLIIRSAANFDNDPSLNSQHNR